MDDLPFVDAIEEELKELKRDGLILDFIIIEKKNGSVLFDIISLEENIIKVDGSKDSGLTLFEKNETYESFEQLLFENSTKYKEKFNALLFKKLEEISDNN